jgi:hypothetical protein
MNNTSKSLSINETFIIEPVDNIEIFSACTGFYSNAIFSCSGNTAMFLNNGVISFNGNLLASSISGGTFYGDGSNLTGISAQGGSFTGGTVTGATIFTNGLTANTISAATYENVSHNNTTGLQGGSSAGAGEYYHLTASQSSRVLNLIYSAQVTTFSISPRTAERGTATTVTASYRMIAGDDVYTGATINPLGYNLYPTFTDGVARTTAFTQSTSANTTTFTLNYGFIRNGVGSVATSSDTLTTYLPQWCGVNVAFSAATNYAAVNALGLTKIVSSSASQSMTPIANNQYIWFISNKSNATITQGGLPTAISNLNVEDGVSDFYLKSFTLTLADGVTTGALYTYISRQSKTLTGVLYTIA